MINKIELFFLLRKYGKNKSNLIDNNKNILLNYIDLFIVEFIEFEKKFNDLCDTLSENAIDKIGDDISLLESMVF